MRSLTGATVATATEGERPQSPGQSPRERRPTVLLTSPARGLGEALSAALDEVDTDLTTCTPLIAPVSRGATGAGLGVMGGPEKTRTAKLRNDGRS